MTRSTNILTLAPWGGIFLSSTGAALFSFGGINVNDLLLVVLMPAYLSHPAIIFFFKYVVKSKVLFFLILLSCLLFFTGYAHHFDFLSAARDARIFIYFSVAFSYSYYCRSFNLNSFHLLIFISFISDFVLNMLFPRVQELYLVKTFYFIFGVSLLITIPAIKKDNFMLTLSILLGLCITITSGYRTTLLIFLTSIFSVLVFKVYSAALLKYSKLSLFFWIGIFITCLGILANYGNDIWILFGDFLKLLSDHLYVQVFLKTNSFFESGVNEDTVVRYYYILGIIYEPLSFLIPYGFGYSTLTGNLAFMAKGVGYSGTLADNGYTWIFVEYGLIPSLILLVLFLYRTAKLFFKQEKDAIDFVIIFNIIPFLMANFSSAILHMPGFAFFTGIYLGLMFSPNRYDLRFKFSAIKYR